MDIKWVILIIFPLINSHLSFSIDNKHIQRYAESESVLDPNGEILLKWKVDYAKMKIRFQLKLAETAPSFKWFAIGFSDRGDFNYSDICLYWTDYKGHEHFESCSTVNNKNYLLPAISGSTPNLVPDIASKDMHADADGNIERDIQQDCKSFSIDTATDSLIFERYFDTCDDDDEVIDDGTVHVVWAHGSDTLFSSNGLCLTCIPREQRGFIRVRLLTPPGIHPTNEYKLSVTNKNVKIPGDDTTYWCKVVKLPDFVTEKPHHIVQFESSITKGNEGIVHHMEVFYCDTDPNTEIPLYEGNCFGTKRPAITNTCSKVKAAWAMGAPPFTYPKEAGLPLGGELSNKYVMLEVHYNNPELKTGKVDSSGIVLHITSTLREYDAAIMELGLEYTDKMAIPGGQAAFPLTGHCVPQCTGVGLPPKGIVIFGSQLHTHLTGVAVWTRHYRNGVELPILNIDKHYSTHFQEIRILHQPVLILPGDYLVTTCIYNTMDKSNATVGGHAITDEMCVNYVHYYPAVQLEVCKSAVSNDALFKYFTFQKDWDKMPISYKASPRDNYLSIQPWTDLRANTLDTLYKSAPISMQCNKSDGTRFQGDWEGLKIPKIRVKLPKQPRICPDIY